MTGGGAHQLPWGMPGIRRLTARPLARATLEPAGLHRCRSPAAGSPKVRSLGHMDCHVGASGLGLGQEGRRLTQVGLGSCGHPASLTPGTLSRPGVALGARHR